MIIFNVVTILKDLENSEYNTSSFLTTQKDAAEEKLNIEKKSILEYFKDNIIISEDETSISVEDENGNSYSCYIEENELDVHIKVLGYGNEITEIIVPEGITIDTIDYEALDSDEIEGGKYD